jgi:hypothetical protein
MIRSPRRKGMRFFCPCHGWPWCGQHYEKVRKRSGGRHRARPERKICGKIGDAIMGLSRPSDNPSPVRVAGAGVASAFAAGNPVLWEYLTADQYDDGSRRTPSSLLVFVESGVVKVCLNDREVDRTLWASGGSLEDALAALDLKAGDGSADWRSKDKKGSAKRR